MQSLIATIRRGRQIKVPVGNITFLCRRPTDEEATKLYSSGASNCDIAKEYVVGWEGVTENDVVGDGGDGKVTFSVALWVEWCVDRVDFWKPIADAVLAAYADHVAKQGTAEKNS